VGTDGSITAGVGVTTGLGDTTGSVPHLNSPVSVTVPTFVSHLIVTIPVGTGQAGAFPLLSPLMMKGFTPSVLVVPAYVNLAVLAVGARHSMVMAVPIVVGQNTKLFAKGALFAGVVVPASYTTNETAALVGGVEAAGDTEATGSSEAEGSGTTEAGALHVNEPVTSVCE